MMKKNIQLRKQGLQRFHEALKQLPLDVDELYQDLNIVPSMMKSSSGSIGMVKYLELLEEASVRTGNRFMGVALAKLFADSNIGILGYILANATDFAESLQLLQRYIGLVSPGSRTEVTSVGEHTILSYILDLVTPEQRIQDSEGTIQQFIQMIKIVSADNEFVPSQIYFEHGSPSEKDLEAVPFEAPIVFNHSFNGVRFPTAILNASLTDPDPVLLGILTSQVEQLCADLLSLSSLAEQLRALLMSSTGVAVLKIGDLCSELGQSKRTLSRRLEFEGTSFIQIRNDVIFQLAKNRLIHHSSSVTEIAQELGYSDSSAFNRAFKKLSGTSPSEYRKVYQGF